jgi:hypothetical protein
MAIFAANSATACLYSTVRNIATTEKYYGFLPEHGKRMACGEELTVWGDIQHWLTRFTPNGRARRSLEYALENGFIVIANTPAVHLFDETLDETKILTLDNGSFAAADPCWGAYSSSATLSGCT